MFPSLSRPEYNQKPGTAAMFSAMPGQCRVWCFIYVGAQRRCAPTTPIPYYVNNTTSGMTIEANPSRPITPMNKA